MDNELKDWAWDDPLRLHSSAYELVDCLGKVKVGETLRVFGGDSSVAGTVVLGLG